MKGCGQLSRPRRANRSLISITADRSQNPVRSASPFSLSLSLHDVFYTQHNHKQSYTLIYISLRLSLFSFLSYVLALMSRTNLVGVTLQSADGLPSIFTLVVCPPRDSYYPRLDRIVRNPLYYPQ